MPQLLPPAVVFIIALAATWAATGLLIPVLRRRRILDHPNRRSSHATPTPRGGGLAVIGCLLPVLAVLEQLLPGSLGGWPILLATAGLALVSWADDLRGLGPWPRLAAQAVAVAVGILVLAERGPVFQGLLPPVVDTCATALCWLWFINLFNFMDGIDGLAGAEATSIGIGLFAVGKMVATVAPLSLPALAIAGAALGFLRWNWHPARIFLGDVGSVPLGYLLGGLLLATAAAGAWPAAVILPLYYLADATWTLLRRIAGGHRPWEAHRTHFYQRAAARGLSHAAVVRAVLALNALLVVLAVAAGNGLAGSTTWRALVAAAAAVALFLAWLGRAPPSHG